MSLTKKDEEDWEKGRKEWLKACEKLYSDKPTMMEVTMKERVKHEKDPKIQALKYLAQSINKEYRDLMRRFILSDYHPMEMVDELYKRNKETIEKI